MAEYGRKQRKQLSRVVANSGSRNGQLKEFVNNRLEIVTLGNIQSTIEHNSLGVMQQKHSIGIRKRLNKKVTKAIRLIQAGGPLGNNATLAEVQAHDDAMNPGQHHPMRNVRRAELIADLVQRKFDHANNNIRDTTLRNNALKLGQGALAAQL